MTALHTYILACESRGCWALFGKMPTHRSAAVVRLAAAREGWTHEYVVGNEARPRSMDFCPACSAKRSKTVARP